MDPESELCLGCLLRHRKACGYEPTESCRDSEGDYYERCNGAVTKQMIADDQFCDCIDEHGELRDADVVLVELITSGMGWLAVCA